MANKELYPLLQLNQAGFVCSNLHDALYVEEGGGVVYLYIQGLSMKPLLPLNQAVLAHSVIVRTLFKALDRAAGPV
jgi:hypothetical protein